MRNLLLLALIGAAASPALGMRRVTVAELQQIVIAQHDAHKSDASIADALSSLQLTEELTAPTLELLKTSAHAGEKTSQALDLIRDASALLPPPAAEVPSSFVPDNAMQRAIIAGAIDFAVKTMARMPDFLATRTTHSFDDSPLVVGHSGYAPITNFHSVGVFNRSITYRDGHEVQEPSAVAAEKVQPDAGPQGLNTSGEFGPVLAIVLKDAAQGTLTWDRWELTESGKAAVFRYVVPESASHYKVDYCCNWAIGGVAYHGTPGYHGDLFIDPLTGAILRITLEADLKKSEVITYAAIVVNYGKVDIGGNPYICPIRSVAISSAMDREGKVIGGSLPVRRINEVSFTNYHRFGSSARIMADASNQLTPPHTDSALAVEEPTPAIAQETAASKPPATDAAPPVETATAAPAAPSTPVSAPAGAARKTEMPPEDLQTPTIKTTTREVVVDVVVTKGNGDPVTGLGREAFSVREDGKPQAIDFFEEHKVDSPTAAKPTEMPPLPSDAVTNVPPAPLADSVNVLLIDMLNTSMRDQVFVHNAIDDFFKTIRPGTRVAIFTLGSRLRFIQGFTSDASVLQSALTEQKNGLTPQKPQASRDRGDAADDAADIARLQMLQASPFAIAALRSEQAANANLAQAQRMSMTFEALNALASYLAGVPGRKNLIWFAGSFPVVIFPTSEQLDSMLKQSQMKGYLDRVKQTADMLTVSKIAVYPVSAEGMMEEHVLEADSAAPGASEGFARTTTQVGQSGRMDPYLAGSNQRADTIAAMERLAASTGGKAFFNTNDLSGAAQRAINDGANYYTLGYAPSNTKMDGSFRSIEVKLAQGKYKLAYRRGYNADDPKINLAETKTDPIAPLLTFGLPQATGILYGVTARPVNDQPDANAATEGQNKSLSGARTRYEVDFIIRARDVALDPSSDGNRHGRLLMGLKAYDRDGKAVNWQAGMETVDITTGDFEKAQSNGLPARLLIDLPSNLKVHLVTAVYDPNTTRAGSAEISLDTNKP